MGIYEELGVRRVISCVGTITSHGQGVMHPEVVKAMAEAAESPVSILELDRRICEIIADTCGSEYALLTTSATGGLVLAFAGCGMRETELANCDPFPEPLHRENPEWRKILRLLQRQIYNPSEIKGIKTEVVVPFGHESIYTICAVYAGHKLVWAGTKEKCTQEQIEHKITDKTAAIFFSGEVMWYHGKPPGHSTDVLSGVLPVATSEPYESSLEEIIEVGHEHDVPIIMDAAYTIPPVENLRKWVEMGVDIACYCGGKSICGPHDVGFDVGRKDLLKLAALHRFPYHGYGRGMKIDPTQMVAMIKAFQIYPKTAEDNRKGAEKVAKWLVEELSKLPHVKSVDWKIGEMGGNRWWPYVCLNLDEESLGITTQDVFNLLYDSNPSIWTSYNSSDCPGGILIQCQSLYFCTRKFPGAERTVFKRLKEILMKKRDSAPSR